MSEKELNMKIELFEMLIDNANKIEKDDQFRYYFGLAKLYVKEDLVNEFDEFVISNYRYGKFKNIIKLIAIFSHEINNNDDISIYSKISDLISIVDSHEIEIMIEIMDNYIKNGEKLKNYLFYNTTSNFVDIQKKKINALSK